jgi:hypothetical protein
MIARSSKKFNKPRKLWHRPAHGCAVCTWRVATAGRFCEEHAQEAARLFFIELMLLTLEQHMESILWEGAR